MAAEQYEIVSDRRTLVVQPNLGRNIHYVLRLLNSRDGVIEGTIVRDLDARRENVVESTVAYINSDNGQPDSGKWTLKGLAA